VIDEYIDELHATLRGPRGVKDELLTEARHSLVDAADAYQERGLDRDAAERQAVAEFGEVREVAPDYQAELAVSQGRRTALLVFFVHTPQHVLSEIAWRSQAHAWTWHPGHAYQVLARIVDWAAMATIAGSLLAVLACGIGVRYLGVRWRLTRAIGLLAIAGCVFFAVTGVLLTQLNPDASAMVRSGPTLLWTVVSSALPLWVVISARRCLSTTHGVASKA
jgi:hypothetical protein